ncbi:helix-turn-helix domain-containing protein [Streptomyces sp. G2]|uniref:helix-turn-helix domain-containing protein n=1 Tax=Streptomyces sp. G2 TaxID=1684471 RepID=UPI00202E3D0F|nr:helix-turn-helix domain-containing protein [Streptomyces sp. G2]MCM1951034.1 helix-turn-helix domain-containing protein [Streptomyces sp. G2]
MLSTEESLRLTVAALMTRTGERQAVVAAALGLSQAQVSRKQSGAAHWSLEDVDGLAAHYGISVLDLLAGPTHAVGVLHGAAPSLQPGVLAVPPVRLAPAAPAPLPAGTPAEAPESEAVGVPRLSVGSCVLCGQPAADEVDGFPQHLSAEECAEAAAAPAGAPAPRPAAVPPAPPAAPAAAPADISPAPVAPAAPVVAPAAAAPAPVVAPVDVPPAPVAPAAPVTAPVAAAPAAAAASAAGRTGTAGYASGSVMEQITDRVHDVLAEQGGDLAAAEAALVKMAIPDVMALMKSSRVGGRYEHSEFPPTAGILHKKSQKGADEIWEGRPKWRNPEIFKAAKSGERFEVTALDMNAAYLSALKCWLPIGQLREDTSGVHDPKKAGVHLITPADWDHTDLPNPLGARQEPGQLWVTESTLRQLLDCARQGLADPPVIHRSLVSGATEALLEKMRRALAEVRRGAIAEGDELTVAYVKAMYSKFVSTIGESSANREIRRPDWMHIIRSKAFANLWMKAHKARTAGLQVVQVSGTDELHLMGDWREVFTEGRDLAQVKVKDTYVLGGKK